MLASTVRMALSISSTIKLNSGHSIPRLGFGVFESTDALKSTGAALQAGYRHIDTARYYHNEPEVAEAVRSSGIDRSSIFITTKVMSHEHGTSATLSAVQDSLKKSKLDYFDLVLLHDPMSGKKKRLEAYAVLNDLSQKGSIKSIGVSNYGVHHLKEIKEAGLPTPTINQIELHPWIQQKEIVSYCNQEGIVVEAYCPLVRGGRMGDKTLKEVCAETGKTGGQVLIRWSLQRGFVPLPKSDTPSRIRDNCDVYSFELSKEQMAKLNALDEGKKGACSWNPVDAP